MTKTARTPLVLAIFGFLIANSGCDENITLIQGLENRPPRIILSGYDYEATRTIRPMEGSFYGPWVLPADPDGKDDIAAVVLKLSNSVLISVIVRPDDSSQSCRRPFYAHMDTINILPYLWRDTFSVTDPLWRRDDDTYFSYLGYDLLSEGGLENHGDVFGKEIKSCYFGSNGGYMYEDFGLYPPALPQARDVFVTYAEFLVTGVSVTVYDQSGDSASVAFPDFRVIFSNDLEDQILP